MAVMLVSIQPASDVLQMLIIGTLIVVGAISLVWAGLFHKIANYPRSRQKLEQKLAKLKEKLPKA
jgi:hypothetical protein